MAELLYGEEARVQGCLGPNCPDYLQTFFSIITSSIHFNNRLEDDAFLTNFRPFLVSSSNLGNI